MRWSTVPALGLVVSLSFTVARAQGPEIVPGDLLVMVKPGTEVRTIARDLAMVNGRSTGLRVEREVSAPMRTWLLHFDPAVAEQPVMLRAVRNHPAVQVAQNNHRQKPRAIPNDDAYGEQWHHANIDSEGAWDISTGGVTADGDTIVVCIIENCDLPHPDLIANAWFNHNEVPDNGQDDDGNGYVDDYRGWNPISGTDEAYGGSHGTEVAGMIGAAGNNAQGVAGANWSVKMMPVFHAGDADDAGVVACYTYPLVMRRLYNATNGERGAYVVATNASWGTDGGQPADAPLWCAMFDTLGTAGILNCGATANQNVNVDVVGDLPTACPSDFMISVTATNDADERTFSAYGLTTIDVGAPGSSVYTTQMNGGYGNASGTSFASPLTAGVIGLLYSAPCATLMTLAKGDPEAGAMFVRQKLFEGVDQVGNLAGQTVTGGRINAGNSMALIMASCGACPAPYNITVQAVDVTAAVISWSAVQGSVFHLRYRLVGAPEWTEVNDVADPAYLISGLQSCAPYEFEVQVECGDETSDYSNTFTWTSEGCCTAPAGLAQGFVGTNIVNVFWNTVLAADTYDLRYAPVSSSDFTVVEALTNAFLEITPLEPCSNYTVQVRSNCDGIETEWSAPIIVGTSGCGACAETAYCATEGGDTAGEWIAHVQVGSIDNTSGNDGGYGDYTSLSTELMVASEHVLMLAPGYSNFAFSEWFRVWMDLDQNGDFAGENELVFDSGSNSNDPLEVMFSIPEDATLGTTRMRVVMRYSLAPASACEPSYDYGETEDYCVTLTANPDAGVGDQVAIPAMVVFPQPADDHLFIRTPAGLHGRTLALRIFDGTGKLVRSASIAGALATLATADLADGLFTYRLIDADAVIGQGRFVIAHAR